MIPRTLKTWLALAVCGLAWAAPSRGQLPSPQAPASRTFRLRLPAGAASAPRGLVAAPTPIFAAPQQARSVQVLRAAPQTETVILQDRAVAAPRQWGVVQGKPKCFHKLWQSLADHTAGKPRLVLLPEEAAPAVVLGTQRSEVVTLETAPAPAVTQEYEVEVPADDAPVFAPQAPRELVPPTPRKAPGAIEPAPRKVLPRAVRPKPQTESEPEGDEEGDRAPEPPPAPGKVRETIELRSSWEPREWDQ